MYGHVHVLISMICYISASMKTRANLFLFVFSIIAFVFVFFFFFSFFFFFFFFSKVSNLKDRLDFYHLSHKLNCLFV